MPEPDEIIRTCMDAWTKDQEEYAAQVAESLDALEKYEQQLSQWQAGLAVEAEQLAEKSSELEEQRQQLIKQQATDLVMTAELDQARAEVDDLRQRLANTTEAAPAASSNSNPNVGLVDPTVSAVAKQFHKLRQQQAARRSPQPVE